MPQFPPKREWGEGEQSWDPLLSPDFQDTLTSRIRPPGRVIPEVDRDVVSPMPHILGWGHPQRPPHHRHPPGPILAISIQEILNHVLDELDHFVSRLKAALGLANTNVKKKKKKKGGEGGKCAIGWGLGGHPGASPPPSLPLQLCPPRATTWTFSRR